jgi:hypothetical protein
MNQVKIIAIAEEKVTDQGTMFKVVFSDYQTGWVDSRDLRNADDLVAKYRANNKPTLSNEARVSSQYGMNKINDTSPRVELTELSSYAALPLKKKLDIRIVSHAWSIDGIMMTIEFGPKKLRKTVQYRDIVHDYPTEVEDYLLTVL